MRSASRSWRRIQSGVTGQIDYNEDPASTATGEHLCSIERAMRSAGIVPRMIEYFRDGQLDSSRSVFADCRIDERALVLAACVRYETGYDPDPQGFDNAWAQLSCTSCRSVIRLQHPGAARPGTRSFP